ncbi:MAG TPA: hypothetical protein VNH11_33995 [Pirellulales bacterium]|nr:hypothetical protein [Pirellulales bacterium]
MPGNNDGFRVLKEFKCQAVADPALMGLAPATAVHGTNEGVRLLPEIVVTAERPEDQEPPSN